MADDWPTETMRAFGELSTVDKYRWKAATLILLPIHYTEALPGPIADGIGWLCYTLHRALVPAALVRAVEADGF